MILISKEETEKDIVLDIIMEKYGHRFTIQIFTPFRKGSDEERLPADIHEENHNLTHRGSIYLYLCGGNIDTARGVESIYKFKLGYHYGSWFKLLTDIMRYNKS